MRLVAARLAAKSLRGVLLLAGLAVCIESEVEGRAGKMPCVPCSLQYDFGCHA